MFPYKNINSIMSMMMGNYEEVDKFYKCKTFLSTTILYTCFPKFKAKQINLSRGLINDH